jgi:hypothetical protein
MDRRSEHRSHEVGDQPDAEGAAPPDGTAEPLDPAELDALLPPVPEGDPEWDAYVRRKVRESLDDPRPSIPAAEVRRHLRERHEARLRRGG